MTAVFIDNGNGTFDLEVDGRARDYDLDPEEFSDALRRARYTGDEAFVEDLTGHRKWLAR